MNKGHLTLLGFILFLVGALSLILGLVGLNLSIFSFLSKFSPIIGLMVKLGFLVIGLLVMYVSKTGFQED